MTFCMLAAHCKKALGEAALMPTLTLDSAAQEGVLIRKTLLGLIYVCCICDFQLDKHLPL